MAEKKKYRVIRGLSWYDDGRAEEGEIRDDIPEASIAWLVKGGHIEEYKPEPKKKAKGGR